MHFSLWLKKKLPQDVVQVLVQVYTPVYDPVGLSTLLYPSLLGHSSNDKTGSKRNTQKVSDQTQVGVALILRLYNESTEPSKLTPRGK